MELDSHAEELASDLGVDKAEVKTDLENLVEYSVPVEEAKRSLRRKYGDGGGGGATPTSTDIAAITTEDSSVTVTAVVLTSGQRRIQYQGDEQVITEGELADETGRISYTAWDEFDMAPGATVRIGNAGVREWDGKPELNLGESTSVDPADASLDVPYEPGGNSDLADLRPGDRGRTVAVAVVEVERRTIDGRDGETDILSGVLADETGRLPFTDWDPHAPLENGESVRAQGAYVREYRGVPEVQFSEFSTVEALDREVSVAESASEMAIGDAVATGGVYDVALVGTVIGIRDGSGLIARCPECNRVVQNGQCRSHGDVEGEDDLRVRAILDDGTGTVTAVLDHDMTSAVYGGDLEDAREAARDAMDREVVAEAIADTLVGQTYRARGHLSVDDYGATLETTSFEPAAVDPAEQAAAVLAEVER
jgi:replication factor A1